MKHQIRKWGIDPSGNEIDLYTLTNDNGITICISSYGAIITSIQTPDRYGVADEIALGFDSAEGYLNDFYINNCPFFGAIAGRYANRIANGEFSIDGIIYRLAKNNLGNSLHGGIKGFDKQLWKGKIISGDDYNGVELTYFSPHLEEGYPGNLSVTVTYKLNNSNELAIEFSASTDQKTVLNLTNHTYFNLSGCRKPITGHKLTIFSRQMLETEKLIPTGEFLDISDTVYDFSKSKTIGRDIDSLPFGYDNSYVLENSKGISPMVALLQDEESGRYLEIFTDEPSLQLYTGFYIPEVTGHKGIKYGKYMGVALETQHFPDSPNQPEFPSTLLCPGETFESKTIFRFGVDK